MILLTKTRDLSQSKDLLTLEQYEQGVELPTETLETNCETNNDDGVEEDDKKDDLQNDDPEATSAKKIKVDET